MGGYLCARVHRRGFQYSGSVVVEGLTGEVVCKQKPGGGKKASIESTHARG